MSLDCCRKDVRNMLQSEFEELWGEPVSWMAYKEVIEPMYLATPEHISKVDFVGMLEPPLAKECKAYNRDSLRHQKALFVKNLGWLLKQTRLDVIECEYIEQNGEELAVIHFSLEGDPLKVNITADSFVAIIRDVCKML